ncbi:MAG: efflux RND transporter periplasmic adaptor subunit [Alkaliphilus sp.]|nr:efflux RND transporter periplasmic adaptor subunit [Alkaliphilus sp.]
MKKVLAIIVASVFMMGSLSACAQKNDEVGAQAEQEKVIAVEVENPKEGNISQSLTLSGRLQPINVVTVIPEVAGLVKVKEVKVALGDMVKLGDILFVLDNEHIHDQIENLRLAYESAQKNFERARENFENSKSNFARNEQLFNEGAISQQQFEQAKLAASDIQMEVLEAQLEQSRFSYINSLEQLENTVVKAPISGYVSSINIQEKGMTTAQPSLMITDISSLEVEILVTEGMINRINKGQEIDMEISSIGNERIKGIVQTISPVPDPITQLYKGKISLENSNQLLRPGMFAKIHLNLDEKRSVMTIPSVAVIETDNETYVYIADDNSAIRTEIKVGMDNGEVVEVLAGLKKEDSVIVKGQDFINDGSIVKVVRGEN